MSKSKFGYALVNPADRATCRPVLTSPLVLVAWRERAAVLWGDSPGGDLWRQMHDALIDPQGWGSYGRPEWGYIKFGHTNPLSSNSGFQTLVLMMYNYFEKTRIPGNQGFGFLAASIVLAVMILPTIINIAEDAIRAVPDYYREGSLALGGTRLQMIVNVVLPAASSGIIAAIILGIGRALGETMAVVMVIGNSTEFPVPFTDNPLTLLLSRGSATTPRGLPKSTC